MSAQPSLQLASAAEERVTIGMTSHLVEQPLWCDGNREERAGRTEAMRRYFRFKAAISETVQAKSERGTALRLVAGAKANGETDNRQPDLEIIDDRHSVEAEWWRLPWSGSELDDLRGFVHTGSWSAKTAFAIQNDAGYTARHGDSSVEKQLADRHPNMPVETELRLRDPLLRENFINAVVAYDSLQRLNSAEAFVDALLAFHARHKFLVLAHCPNTYHRLGLLLSNLDVPVDKTAVLNKYERLFMDAMMRPISRQRHVSVLYQLLGLLSRKLDPEDRQELDSIIQSYRAGQVPLIAPILLIKHYVRKFGQAYLSAQRYLNPHPDELGLRSAI